MTTFSAVATTGIYCRPGCRARPLPQNTQTFELAAAAEAAGFRACHRCRPYRVSGPVGFRAPEIVCEAVQRIIGGALDNRGTEDELASQIGMSARNLRRLFVKHLGTTPDQLARSRRAHFARRLLDDTDLPIIDVAFASGFSSLRQFNRSMQEIFQASPTALRSRRRRDDRLIADGGIALRLPVHRDYDWDAVRSFLSAKAIPGVETVDGESYRRTITMAGAPGLLEVSLGDRTPSRDRHLILRAHLPYWEGLIHLVEHVARILGVDSDHAVRCDSMAPDHASGPRRTVAPQVLVPDGWSAFEVGVWAILAARPDCRETLGAVVTHLGGRVPGLPDGLTHTFPEPAEVTHDTLKPLRLRLVDSVAIASLAKNLASCPASSLDPKLWEPWLTLATTRLTASAVAA